MTVQIETPAPSLLAGGWAAALEYTTHQLPVPAPRVEPASTGDQAEPNIFGPQIGLWNKIHAYRARRRLNRAFRRDQREFDNVLDAMAGDPAAQRELSVIWTIGH